ncbi:hypothetical protein UFOVP164_37 [uncultured Caudovirales phage]|uniref:Uncharacterized protein n=1 Tax=uncultured Caudovirales phage TaxID=2100421 RepID=A0A6J7XMG9_9CAUD|nr:hypothetical protein UFOVP164_37 [uncultured Caudovirales phage]
MGQCKQLEIENIERAQWLEFITNAPLECGSIGVCLDDTRTPPRYYEFDGYIDMKTVELVLLDSENPRRMYTRRVPIDMFWPLT